MRLLRRLVYDDEVERRVGTDLAAGEVAGDPGAEHAELG